MSKSIRDGGGSPDSCADCVVAAASRRAFLRDAGLAVLGALGLSAISGPGTALAESVLEIRAAKRRGMVRTYAIPRANSISVDRANDVILARWQDRVYAFSLRCPHRGTRLEWRANEERIFCPKHKARFLPDGSHVSGRRSRDLDRYDIRRQGSSLAVDLDALRRVDQDADAWGAAVIVVD